MSIDPLRPASRRRPLRRAALPAGRVALLVAGLLPGLAGCGLFSPLPTSRGTMIEAVDYNRLVPGKSTRNDVVGLIGSPTTHATFDDNTWIYIGEVTSPVPTSRPRVEQQQVVVLNFDQNGVLRDRRRLTRADGHDVAMAGGATPSPGSETSFMQQLIGNVGRYSPLGGLGANQLGNSNTGYGHGGTGNTLGGP